MSRRRIQNNLGQFITQTQAKAARSMTQALIIGSSEAASMTPIDTSMLINSQFRRVDVSAGKVTGTAGYTAVYALAVHEMDDSGRGKPRPSRGGIPQGVTWGPAGESEFLKKGFEQAEPNIRAVIVGAISA